MYKLSQHYSCSSSSSSSNDPAIGDMDWPKQQLSTRQQYDKTTTPQVTALNEFRKSRTEPWPTLYNTWQSSILTVGKYHFVHMVTITRRPPPPGVFFHNNKIKYKKSQSRSNGSGTFLTGTYCIKRRNLIHPLEQIINKTNKKHKKTQKFQCPSK